MIEWMQRYYLHGNVLVIHDRWQSLCNFFLKQSKRYAYVDYTAPDIKYIFVICCKAIQSLLQYYELGKTKSITVSYIWSYALHTVCCMSRFLYSILLQAGTMLGLSSLKFPPVVKTEINLVLVLVTVLGFWTRLRNLSYPRAVVWVYSSLIARHY